MKDATMNATELIERINDSVARAEGRSDKLIDWTKLTNLEAKAIEGVVSKALSKGDETQYDFGYEDGVNSRDNEVESLEDDISDLKRDVKSLEEDCDSKDDTINELKFIIQELKNEVECLRKTN
jgi:predicted RNase H-like nuclease (RuvC/YqgF family)